MKIWAVSGARLRAVGRESHRPAGGMAVRAQRILSQRHACARSRHARLARAGRGGRFLALKHEVVANLGAYVSAVGADHPDARLRQDGAERLRIAGHAYPRARRLHQHRADRCLSRRRQARGAVRAGAVDRHRRARNGHRPRRVTPAQSRAADDDAVQDRVGTNLRRRRFPARAEQGAVARRCGQFCEAAQAVGEGRAPARAGPRLLHPRHRRRSGRNRQGRCRAVRRARRLHKPAGFRTGTSHGLRADSRRPVRHSDRPHRDSPGRQPNGAARRRHRRLVVADHRRRRDGRGRAGDDRSRHRTGGARTRSRKRRRRVSRRRLRGEGHGRASSACSNSQRERSEPLEGVAKFDEKNASYPYGCQVAEVEVDPADGCGRDPELPVGGRSRPHHPSGDGRRPARRRHRAGARAGALRAGSLRCRVAASC